MGRIIAIGRVWHKDGKVAAAGTATFFASGTATKKLTYSDVARTVENVNPITLNVDGELPVEVFGSGAYTVTVVDVNGGSVTSENDVSGHDAVGLTYSQGGTGAAVRTVESRLQDAVSVLDFGVKFDGSTDDTVNFQKALDIGGKITMPKGTVMVSGLVINNSVVLEGMGTGDTTIKLINSSNDTVIAIGTGFITDVTMRDFKIDGNKANNENGHGIRLQDCQRIWMENLFVTKCDVYGIGMQATAAMKEITINNVHVSETGADGIDFKDVSGNNDGIIISNVTVEKWGQDEATKNGIDIRGPATLSNIFIRNPPNDGTGVNFRLEGARSSISNFHMIMNDNTTQGIGVASPADVSISNGYIGSALIGINVIGARCRITNVSIEGAGDAGVLAGVGGDGCQISNSVFENCSEAFDVKGDNVQIYGNHIIDSTSRAFGTSSTADNTQIHHNLLEGTNSVILDNGTNTSIHSNDGYTTENSGLGSITSGGTTDIITHGLAITPTAANISITLAENPTNTPGAIWVDTITSSVFTVNCENDPGASNLDFGWTATNL